HDCQHPHLDIFVLDQMNAALHAVLTVFDKPLEMRFENAERLYPLNLEPLDRIERDDSYKRPHAKLVKASIGIAHHVVKESVAFVPQRIIAPSPSLHRRAYVDVVLEKFCRKVLIHVVVFCKLERDAHQVQTEHPHPSSRVALLQNNSAGKLLTPIDHRYVVET